MIGCGLAMSFEQLLVARWLTGIGSALQNTGAQLFLADISTPANRAQSLGTNQVGPGDMLEFRISTHSTRCDACLRIDERQCAPFPLLVVCAASTYLKC